MAETAKVITLFNDCDEYMICGCATVDEDLHCSYCCDPPNRHSEQALDAFLRSTWPADDRRRVAASIGRDPEDLE